MCYRLIRENFKKDDFHGYLISAAYGDKILGVANFLEKKMRFFSVKNKQYTSLPWALIFFCPMQIIIFGIF
jgi:hypothetical protein